MAKEDLEKNEGLMAYNPKHIKFLGEKKLFHQVDFEEETVGEHMEHSNSVKDIGTIGCCSKRRMSAVRFGAN